MPVTASDIIVYGAANMTENDTSSVGGAIDKTIKMMGTDMSDVGGTDTLNIVSDDAGDTTQTVTITGRDSTGVIVSEILSLNGTTPVSGSQSFERVLKIVVNASYDGTITVSEDSGSQTLVTLEGADDAPGGAAVLQARRLFYNSIAGPTTPADDKLLYEKVFIANTHATLALTSAAVELTVDGTTGDIIDFDLEVGHNGSNAASNRLTEPAGSGMVGAPTWNDTQKSVPSGALNSRTGGVYDHIGVWLRMDLDGATAPEKASITLTVTGNTT